MIRAGLVFCILFFALSTARTQIINIEDSRKKIDSVGLFGQLDLTFSLVQSSKQLLTFKGTSRADWIRPKGAWMGILDYRVIINEKDNLQDDGFFHLRYGRLLNKRFTWEAFSQLQHNRQLRIDLRWLAGTGPRFLLYNKPRQKAYLGVLYMFEYDEIVASNTIWRDHRLSSYLSVHLQLTPNLDFASTSYYQPLIGNFAESRVSSVNSLSFKFTDHLQFRIQFNISYDGRLAKETENVPATVYNFTNGLRWAF